MKTLGEKTLSNMKVIQKMDVGGVHHRGWGNLFHCRGYVARVGGAARLELAVGA
ncbi:hypothetical protein Fmac_017056 [Flemingia macrophylla]|uniref:Uncharacterized protein n=1 Tax=Flemingia macrophylla TaxID=520843 RepID=A0ABD1M112_9FABA